MPKPRERLEKIIKTFSINAFEDFFRKKANFQYLDRKEREFKNYEDEDFKDSLNLGYIKYSNTTKVLVCAFRSIKELTEKSAKQNQYKKAKKILSEYNNYKAGIFIFYSSNGNFRFSLVYPQYIDSKKTFNNFRRYTYFVSKDFTNKTFLNQIGEKDFTTYENLKEAFSITAVTDTFYNEFFDIYEKIVKHTQKINNIENYDVARDFVLLFSIRTIFIGFIQKKKWLANDEKFLVNFFEEYSKNFYKKNKFYKRWLSPLFFEALNSQPGTKVAYGNNDFSKRTEEILQMSPYLNGGLFREKKGYDNKSWYIKDEDIKVFFDFLFAHSFTIEENSLEDEELQLNPEFLGIIFERLVNKADGAVYTPRTEVDLMCRLSLLKWLQKNLSSKIKIDNLYELFFLESQQKEEQKYGSFSQKEAQEILDKLQNITICDPAVGSGAFLVGMMQVLDEIEQSLKQRYNLKTKSLFERKKEIIKNCLYGVEIKEWAVWICQLRLWLSLFVDTPDELKDSFEPILPSLDFKVRKGDSLVQIVGSKQFAVIGHNDCLPQQIKTKVAKLKNHKKDFFENKKDLTYEMLQNEELNIYKELIQREIKDTSNELEALSAPQYTQGEFCGFEKKEKESNLYEKRIEELKIKLQNLQQQEKQLSKENKPLIWSIEFADIFADETKGGFDIIIANPPYIKYKNISDATNKIKDDKIYRQYLAQMVQLDFPEYFKNIKSINAKSDLYVYFYIRSLRLLNRKGIQVFICENSWLDVDYGCWLQKFLLEHCNIDFIIDNSSKRSFSSAAVNTIISVINAPTKMLNENKIVKFILFKKPFEETIFTENLIDIETTTEITKNENYRIYPISQKQLLEEGTKFDNNTKTTGTYEGDKWGGKYLKAPDIFFTILEKGNTKFIKIGEDKNLEVKTGVKEAGYSEYIINKSKLNVREYTKSIPIIKNVKQNNNIDIQENDSYIYKKIRHFKESTKNKIADILWVTGRDKICKCHKNSNKFIFSGNYIGIDVLNKSLINTYLLLLNSIVTILLSELASRNQGEGVAFFTKPDIEKIYIPIVDVFGKYNFNKLFNILKKRDFKSVFEECGIDPKSSIPIEQQIPNPLPDRAELDNIVFDVLNLTKEERIEVYRAVCRLVYNRITKAKSV